MFTFSVTGKKSRHIGKGLSIFLLTGRLILAIMVFLEVYEDFEKAAERLYLNAPMKVCVKFVFLRCFLSGSPPRLTEWVIVLVLRICYISDMFISELSVRHYRSIVKELHMFCGSLWIFDKSLTQC